MRLLRVGVCHIIHKSIFSLLKKWALKVKIIVPERASPGLCFDKKLLYVE
jgi:hypothetical protein